VLLVPLERAQAQLVQAHRVQVEPAHHVRAELAQVVREQVLAHHVQVASQEEHLLQVPHRVVQVQRVGLAAERELPELSVRAAARTRLGSQSAPREKSSSRDLLRASVVLLFQEATARP
jgi:hypothetical protein